MGNEEADPTSPTQAVEGAAAAEGLNGPDAVVDLVGDDDVVVVEAAAEADCACGVLVVLQGDDDGRVGVEPVVVVLVKTIGNLITSQYCAITLSENLSMYIQT